MLNQPWVIFIFIVKSNNFSSLKATIFRNSRVQCFLCIDFVLSKAVSRYSCAYVFQNCVCHVQNFRVVIFVSRLFNFERTMSPCAFILVWAYENLAWDLSLGRDNFCISMQKWTWQNACKVLVPHSKYILRVGTNSYWALNV